MSQPSAAPAAAPSAEPASASATQTDVYAIQGADPEVLAYAMAKYSRSALSMKESLSEISSQRAEQFLNTFYFQYGHRSIADLAHIPFAIERLSLLAAIALVDEQRWDGQERSTRYQNFRKSGWFTPELSGEPRLSYTRSIDALFAAYDQIGDGAMSVLEVEGVENLLGALRADLRQRLLHGERRPRILCHRVGQHLGVRTMDGIDIGLGSGSGRWFGGGRCSGGGGGLGHVDDRIFHPADGAAEARVCRG
jgi:hypothetical protein